jgi:hypothetical protein
MATEEPQIPSRVGTAEDPLSPVEQEIQAEYEQAVPETVEDKPDEFEREEENLRELRTELTGIQIANKDNIIRDRDEKIAELQSLAQRALETFKFLHDHSNQNPAVRPYIKKCNTLLHKFQEKDAELENAYGMARVNRILSFKVDVLRQLVEELTQYEQFVVKHPDSEDDPILPARVSQETIRLHEFVGKLKGGMPKKHTPRRVLLETLLLEQGRHFSKQEKIGRAHV